MPVKKTHMNQLSVIYYVLVQTKAKSKAIRIIIIAKLDFLK